MNVSEGYGMIKDKAERFIADVSTLKVLSQKEGGRLPYAYPCDNYIEFILSFDLVRNALQSFADKYCKEQIQSIRKTAQPVNEKNYPRLNNILNECYESLNVTDFPEVFVSNRLKGINAISVGTDNRPIILISQKSVIVLSDGELKFMIGHELGHILQKNLMCHTIKGMLDNLNSKSEIIGSIVSDIIDVPLNQWFRCTEYTADRAGYICCGDKDTILILFSKLSEKKLPSSFYNCLELFKDHPYIQNRILQIDEYSTTIINN